MTIPLTNEPKDILSAWIALEVLSPQTFRKKDDLAGANGSIVHFDKSPLPWQGVEENSKPNYRLYYQIVLGTIDFGKAISALLNVYADKKIERPATNGEAILAVIMVDKTGRLIDEPAIGLSSFAWGVPQALNGDLRALAQWTDAENSINQTLDMILRRVDQDGQEIPLDAATLKYAADYLVSELKIPTELITGNSFAIRSYQYNKNPEAPEPLLLNSFFIGDLIAAGNLFKEGKATSNLQYYVGQIRPGNRRDLLHNRSALEHALAPESVPPARWPGPGRHPLVVLQQAAVNSVFKELKTNGILAVNGPPGTGKTTLLRDIVAGVITQRAEAMCEFDDPADAFTNSREKLSTGPAFWTLYELDERLKGFELVIASSNNKAVENVSAELPGINAIASDADDLRYFTCTSDSLLEKESWGVIAAVLGNATNRARFREKFWWDKDNGLATYLAEVSGTPQFINVTDSVTGNIISQRKPKIIIDEDAPDATAANARWQLAREEFQAALQKSKSALSELEKVRKTVISLNELIVQEKPARLAFTQALSDEKLALSEAEASDIMYNEVNNNLKELEEDLSAHKQMRPDFFARLFGSPDAKVWKQEHKGRVENYNLVQKELSDHKKLLEQSLKTLEAKKKIATTCQEKLQKLTEKIASTQQKIERERIHIGPHMVDNTFFELPHEKRQVISPWCTKSVQQLRDDVFIAAIKLHKAFIDAAARPIRHNISVLMTVFSGKELPDKNKQKLLADLWSTLFLIVPSVSTTFASIERMLGKLPPDSLGWLLIDEAGQALPQAAVGAIMRVRRAVIVGDPLQIQPVVTLPDTMTHSICQQFGVDPDRFNAPEASTQTLADAATVY